MTVVDEKLFDVVYLIESSIANGSHYEGLKTHYLIPSVRYFNGGAPPMETDWLGSENNATQFCLLLFNNKLKFVGNVTNEGITRNPHKFTTQLNNLKLTHGSLSDHSHLSEGLAVALQVFDNLAKQRGPAHSNVMKHCIVVGHLPPMTIPVLISGAYNGFSFDRLLDTFNKKGINLSVISGRIVNQFKDLITKTSPHDAKSIISKSSQYAADPKHMVFLKGLHLPDTSVEPSPIKTENSKSEPTRKRSEPDPAMVSKTKMQKTDDAPSVANIPNTLQPSPKPALPTYPAPYNMSTATKSPKTAVQPSQLSNFPNFPQTQPVTKDTRIGITNEKTRQHAIPDMQQPPPAQQPTQQPPPPQQPQACPPPAQQAPQQERKLAWTGQLQWQETTVSGNEPGKSILRVLPCHATIAANENLKTDVWPQTLQMQLIPQTYLTSLNRFLKNAKTVTFQFSTTDSDVLQAMYRVMNGGGAAGGSGGQKFAGCVILNPPNPPNPNHVRVLLLLYHTRKKTFMGVIPDEQQTFVNELGATISADKNRAKQHQLTGQVRPARPVAPVMNSITSTNQVINPNQISTPPIMGRQIQNPSLRSLLTTNNIQQLQQQQQHQQVSLQQHHQQVTLQQQLQPQPLQQVRPVNPLNWSILQQQQQQQQQQHQHNQRQVQVANAMALAQQQQPQLQPTQLNDVQMTFAGDFSNPVMLNSLQPQ